MKRIDETGDNEIEFDEFKNFIQSSIFLDN